MRSRPTRPAGRRAVLTGAVLTRAVLTRAVLTGVVLAGAVLAVAPLRGCAAGTTGPDEEPGGTITVLAAASLTDAFTTLGTRFETAHPGTTVRFSFGGSSALAQQINAGAPADVFAAASASTMRQVADAANTAGPSTVFAHNQLVIVVPKGNPRRVTDLAGLAQPGMKVALCAEQVPCGAAARSALAAARVALTPVTLEADVRAALTKVRLGEVDAALVYRTDAAAAAGAVDGVEFPESASARTEYVIATLAHAPNPVTAQAFVAFILSAPALADLTAAGFQAP